MCRDGRDIAHTSTDLPSNSSREIDLLFERPIGEVSACFDMGIRPLGDGVFQVIRQRSIQGVREVEGSVGVVLIRHGEVGRGSVQRCRARVGGVG